MPDYANMNLPPMYRHELKAFEPQTGREIMETPLDPEKRYTLEFLSKQVAPETLRPEQIQEAIESRRLEEQRQFQMPEWTETTDIDDMPEQDYNLGRLTIRRQFLDDMKIVNALPPESMEKMVLGQEAGATMQTRMARLNMNRDRAQQAFEQLNHNGNLGREERYTGKTRFYEANPVWKPPKVEYPEEPRAERPAFTAGQVQRTLGELATNTMNIIDRETAIAFAAERLGPNFAEEYPEAMDIIERRAETDFEQPIPLRGVPEPEVVPETEGKPTFWQRLFDKKEEPLAAVEIPGEIPPRPTGYPDAVWNPRFKIWTRIQGGRLVGIREKP